MKISLQNSFAALCQARQKYNNQEEKQECIFYTSVFL